MMVACTDALRYGGTDEQILKRLYENGMKVLCDQTPQLEYPVVVRNRVTFICRRPVAELAVALTGYLQRLAVPGLIRDHSASSDEFRFTHRWVAAYPGNRYEGRRLAAEEVAITVLPERKIREDSVGSAGLLFDFLRQQPDVTNMQWWPTSCPAGVWYEKPF
jgi:hypothetical protein